MFIVLCIITSTITQSQKLYVANGGVVRITPTAFVYAGGDVEVVAGGDLSVDSDATDSGSFLAPTGTTNISGNISYMRHVNDTDWHLVSAPVTTQDIKDFATNASNAVADNGTVYGIGAYNNENAKGSRWENYPMTLATGANFENGTATSNKRTAAGDYTYTGNMAADNVVVEIPKYDAVAFVAPTSVETGTHVWSAVGNPYPSFIAGNANGSKDVDPLGTDVTSNILADNLSKLNTYRAYLYVWDGSAYQIVNHASDSFILAPGQGFLVDPIAYNTMFTFTESYQTIQQATPTTFFKSSPTPAVTVNLSNGKATKKTQLKYFSNTTEGLDIGWDAGAFETSSFSIDTHLIKEGNGINFALQCLPDSNYETSIVPLAVNAAENEKITFTSEAVGLPEGIKVYLEDKTANTITDITSASYQVTLNNVLNGIGRFYIHTSAKVLSVDDSLTSAALNLYKTSNNSIRITGLNAEENTSIKMYSITGKEVFTKQFSAKNISDVAIPASLATGVYIVNVISKNVELNKKVIIE